VKEGKSRRTAAFWLLGVGGVLITAAIIALYTPWLPIFDLRQISISGNLETPARDVVRALSLSRGIALPSISLSAAAERISTLPWVKEARVFRVFPHRLRIVITEREPVARLLDGDKGCWVLGEGGVVVSDRCDEAESLVALAGVGLLGTGPGARLADGEAVDLLRTLRGAELPGLTVERIEVSGQERMVELTDDSGIRVLLGSLAVATERVAYLEALCRSMDIQEYELIDLRYGGEATLVPRARR
jgi:cell division septal protein FtsQ